MQAQDKPEIETVYDVYLNHKDEHHFCKRYKRERSANLLADALKTKYGHWGYTTHIDVIEIPTEGLRPENGGHTAGSSPKETGEPPTE